MTKRYFLFIFLLFFSAVSYATIPFKLGNTTFQVTEVTTPAAQQQGLSGVKSLAPDEGMLFIFPESGYHVFWMKNMLFPLDIIWLDDKYNIVYVKQNLEPCTPSACPGYVSGQPAKYVLEIPAGTFQRL